MSKQNYLVIPEQQKNAPARELHIGNTNTYISDESSAVSGDNESAEMQLVPSLAEKRKAKSLHDKTLADNHTIVQNDEIEGKRDIKSRDPKKARCISELMKNAESQKLKKLIVGRNVQIERAGEEFKDEALKSRDCENLDERLELEETSKLEIVDVYGEVSVNGEDGDSATFFDAVDTSSMSPQRTPWIQCGTPKYLSPSGQMSCMTPSGPSFSPSATSEASRIPPTWPHALPSSSPSSPGPVMSPYLSSPNHAALSPGGALPSHTPLSPTYIPTSPAYLASSPKYSTTSGSPQYTPGPPQQYSPASPKYSPTSPLYSPASPQHSPAKQYSPTGSSYSSTSPRYSPNMSIYSPSSTKYSPASPPRYRNYSPASPMYSPTAPSPTSPAYSPSSPTYEGSDD